MNQSVKLAALATLLAASALAAGCVPSLNYGSVPPEPKYTTKVTTTTATSATKKPFTTPKPRTGTISWEELNGPLERSTRAVRTEAVYTGYTGVAQAAGDGVIARGRGRSLIDDDDSSSGNDSGNAGIAQTAAPQQEERPVIQTEPPAVQTQAGPPPTAAPDPPADNYDPAPAEIAPAPVQGPPPVEQPAEFWE